MDLYVEDKYDSRKHIDARNPVIVAKGGDGTLLKAINKFRQLGKPFFGIAAGTENFLMNSKMYKPRYYIDPKAKRKRFTLIKVKVTALKVDEDSFKQEQPYEHSETYQAFNDVMIGGDMNSWIDFNVHDKDRIIGKFKGGGLIFSTAQGSTGINKNNGGTILPLSSHNWVVTGDKTNRKIHYVLEPSHTSITCFSRKPITVWIDGANHIITNVTKIEISRGDVVTVIFNDYDDFKRKRKL